VNKARDIRFPTQTEIREQINIYNLLRSSWFHRLLSWIASSETEPSTLSVSFWGQKAPITTVPQMSRALKTKSH